MRSSCISAQPLDLSNQGTSLYKRKVCCTNPNQEKNNPQLPTLPLVVLNDHIIKYDSPLLLLKTWGYNGKSKDVFRLCLLWTGSSAWLAGSAPCLRNSGVGFRCSMKMAPWSSFDGWTHNSKQAVIICRRFGFEFLPQQHTKGQGRSRIKYQYLSNKSELEAVRLTLKCLRRRR